MFGAPAQSRILFIFGHASAGKPGILRLEEPDHVEMTGLDAPGRPAAEVALYRTMIVVPPLHSVERTGLHAGSAAYTDLPVDGPCAGFTVVSDRLLRAGIDALRLFALSAYSVNMAAAEDIEFDRNGRSPAVLVTGPGLCTDHLAIEAPGTRNGIDRELSHQISPVSFR